jgi:hypothetical protein
MLGSFGQSQIKNITLAQFATGEAENYPRGLKVIVLKCWLRHSSEVVGIGPNVAIDNFRSEI